MYIYSVVITTNVCLVSKLKKRTLLFREGAFLERSNHEKNLVAKIIGSLNMVFLCKVGII
nr:MAG TPA: hypothetical protein [Caudoviricetes sp.]